MNKSGPLIHFCNQYTECSINVIKRKRHLLKVNFDLKGRRDFFLLGSATLKCKFFFILPVFYSCNHIFGANKVKFAMTVAHTCWFLVDLATVH